MILVETAVLIGFRREQRTRGGAPRGPRAAVAMLLHDDDDYDRIGAREAAPGDARQAYQGP